MRAGLGLLVAGLFFLGSAHAESRPAFPILNLEDAVRELGLRSYYPQKNVARPVKVAILDNGFTGYEKELGLSLPANTQYHAGPVTPPEGSERHGLAMAQIFYGLVSDSGKSPQFLSELHLYNTYGYSNLKAAVTDAIQRGIDVILYSQVWEYGGNGDGRGFINAVVKDATAAGILWVNASGDFGNTTFNSAVVNGNDDWIQLPGPNQSVELRCEPNEKKSCNVRLVLSWNDFKDDIQFGTDKDLDLVLTDDTLNIVRTSTLIQTTDRDEKPGYSLYPREIITAELKPGLYFVRVKNRSKNFGSHDRLRITASGDFISIPRHDSAESLLNPADNARVITVGSSDSEKTSVSRALRKPEISTRSLVKFSETEQYKGTSNSAAMAAAFFAIQKSLHPSWDRETLLDAFLTRPNAQDPTSGQGLPLSALGFTYTGRGCFLPVDLRLNPIPAYVQYALGFGGTFVETTAGRRIFYDFDPIRLTPHIRRVRFDDILVVGPPSPQAPTGATGLYPRTSLHQLHPALFELVQVPQGQRICR